MLDTKLTTCAYLLYQWIVPRVTAGEKTKVDLQDFQAWTAEYREKPYSDREILDALRQLKELQLINVSRTEVTLEVNQVQYPSLNVQQPAQLLLNEESDRPNRFMLLRIIVSSLILGLTSIGFGLAFSKIHPPNYTPPDAGNFLGGNNIDLNK